MVSTSLGHRLKNLGKLHLVPVQALRFFARRRLTDQGLSKVAKSADIGSVIRNIDDDNSIQETDIENLYDEHRYDGRLGLRLYFMPSDASIPAISDLCPLVTEELANIVKEQPDISGASIRNLRLGKYEEFGQFIEISYKFNCPLYYIDEHGELAGTLQTQQGFLWLNTADKFVAVTAKDDHIIRPVKNALSRVLGVHLRPMPFAQDVIDDHFSDENLRRVNHIDSATGTKYSASGDYADLESYVTNNDVGRQRTGAMYSKEICPGVQRNVGVNSKISKLYFTRALPADQMRQWATGELCQIVRDVRDWETQHKSIVSSHYERVQNLRISQEAKSTMEAILDAVLAIKRGGSTELPIDCSAPEVLASLGTHYFTAKVSAECDRSECDDPACRCPTCGGSKLGVESQSVTCVKCSHTLSAAEIVTLSCLYGHQTTAELHDCLILRPKAKLIGILVDVLRGINKEWDSLTESIEIRGSSVSYFRKDPQGTTVQTNVYKSTRDFVNLQTGAGAQMSINAEEQ